MAPHGGGPGQAGSHPIYMKIGQDAQEGLLLLAQVVDHGLALLEVGPQVEVGEHTPLGHARGAAGVLEQGQVLGIDPLVGVGLVALEQGLERQDPLLCRRGRRARSCFSWPGPCREGSWEISGRPPMVVTKNFSTGMASPSFSSLGQSRSRVIQKRTPASLNWWTISVSMYRGFGHDAHGPGPEHAPEGHDGLGQVGQHHGHAVALADPGLAEIGGHDLGSGLELGVVDRPVLEDDGPFVSAICAPPGPEI